MALVRLAEIALTAGLLAACAGREPAATPERRIVVEQKAERTLVCTPPREADPAAWPETQPETGLPPPWPLLRDGLYLACLAHQQAALSGDAYRDAILDQGKTLLIGEAALSLAKLGGLDAGRAARLRGWQQQSAFVNAACAAAIVLDADANNDHLDSAILDYCRKRRTS